MKAPIIVARLAGLLLATASLSACAYDYLQHGDSVSYAAGDAVRANLEAQTVNPQRRSLYSTAGLGSNGHVIPGTSAGSTGTTAPASTTPASTP